MSASANTPLRQLPWYSFLYRFLGAQGTFWLWLLAPLTLWWTAQPAMIRVANRSPRALTVRTIESQPLVRWVRLSGLRLSLDRRLLLRDSDPKLPPLELLVDRSDPSVAWWSETHALTEPVVGLAPISAQGGVIGVLPQLARRKLVRRFAKLKGESTLYLPAPENAVLLLGEESSPVAFVPNGPAGDAVHSFASQTEAQIARVRERVEPGAVVQGVLASTPSVLGRRFRDELDFAAPAFELDVGRRPRELEAIVFAVALIVLLFLGAGLFGTRGVPTNDSEPAS